MIIKIADYYNVSADYLLGIAENQDRYARKFIYIQAEIVFYLNLKWGKGLLWRM